MKFEKIIVIIGVCAGVLFAQLENTSAGNITSMNYYYDFLTETDKVLIRHSGNLASNSNYRGVYFLNQNGYAEKTNLAMLLTAKNGGNSISFKVETNNPWNINGDLYYQLKVIYIND